MHISSSNKKINYNVIKDAIIKVLQSYTDDIPEYNDTLNPFPIMKIEYERFKHLYPITRENYIINKNELKGNEK